jgi:ABC-type Fe3+-siderophore transport system permease subunit
MEIDIEAATANSPPSAQAIAALGLAAALMESLVRGGLIDQEVIDAIVKDGASYVQALCTDCPPEVEPQALAILKLLGKPPAGVPPSEATASA